MKLLLDTHVWLWSILAPAKLPRRAKSAINRSSNELWLSPISVWELLVLVERGRLRIEAEPRRWIEQALARTPAQEAQINFEVALRSREVLPMHADPADRILVATALVNGFTLVTADQSLIDARPCAILPAL
ncbi:MAG: type II toxin-antitoxin system VapC family toxin [Burkholderiales bacterium]|nr:type II toxin-antitoxin system VapC family toxin [Burkholderiales bacterium]